MVYDDSFAGLPAAGIDLAGWDERHRAFWSDRLGRRYLLSVVPSRARRGRILEIGAAWYNKYQKEVVGRDNELTIFDVKEPDHPDVTSIPGLDRYCRFDMTTPPGAAGAPEGCLGFFDEIRSWGVLSHYGFSPAQCRDYLGNVHAFLRAGGQAIFKLDRDTHKAKKFAAAVSVEWLVEAIADRFTLLHADTLVGNTPGEVLYVEKR